MEDPSGYIAWWIIGAGVGAIVGGIAGAIWSKVYCRYDDKGAEW